MPLIIVTIASSACVTCVCVFWYRVACGIIAKASGLFENPKRICPCSGATLWDERDIAKRWPTASQLRWLTFTWTFVFCCFAVTMILLFVQIVRPIPVHFTSFKSWYVVICWKLVWSLWKSFHCWKHFVATIISVCTNHFQWCWEGRKLQFLSEEIMHTTPEFACKIKFRQNWRFLAPRFCIFGGKF